jgi:predicted Rossmann fold nucleotide-binding protein DprA/Smf involved in DNA uptake
LEKYFQIIEITSEDPLYPKALRDYLYLQTPPALSAIGNIEISSLKKLAFFCSVKCPGHLILKTYDLSQSLKQAGITVIGGFHSPIERECLRILLRGMQPIIVCPARSLKGMRLRAEYKEPIEKGRLLLFSPFKENQRRNTAETAIERNRFVAAMADAIFIAYASPNSKTEIFCKDVLKWGKPIYTLGSGANKTLITLGAKPISIANMFKWA